MGFDEGSNQPILQPRKKSTEVNLWIAASVIVFLLIGIFYYAYTEHHRREVQMQVQQSLPQKP